jgi:hypothetical protein
VGVLVASAVGAGFYLGHSGSHDSQVTLRTTAPAGPKKQANTEGSRASTKNSQAVPSRGTAKPAVTLRGLKRRLEVYLHDFDAYHEIRHSLGKAERATRLAGFRQRLEDLLGDYGKAGRTDSRFLSQLHRELGTVAWYQAQPDAARSHWRQAIALDPGDSLAAKWLRETEGAVLKE